MSACDTRTLLAALRAAGCTVTRSKHWLARTPGGRLIVVPVTPSCPRSVLNVRAHARRALQAEGLRLGV